MHTIVYVFCISLGINFKSPSFHFQDGEMREIVGMMPIKFKLELANTMYKEKWYVHYADHEVPGTVVASELVKW